MKLMEAYVKPIVAAKKVTDETTVSIIAIGWAFRFRDYDERVAQPLTPRKPVE